MGCWNQTCGFSQLPIGYSEEDKLQPRVVGFAEGNQGAFHPSLLKKIGKTYTEGSACMIVALDWDGVNIPYRGNVIVNQDGTFFKHGSRELWVRAGYSQSATVHWPGAKARALQLIESAIYLREAGVSSAGSAILRIHNGRARKRVLRKFSGKHYRESMVVNLVLANSS